MTSGENCSVKHVNQAGIQLNTLPSAHRSSTVQSIVHSSDKITVVQREQWHMQQAPWTTPPTREHLAQIAVAKRTSAKIRRAVQAGTFSAWTTALFAITTLLFLAFGFSFWGFVLGAGMSVIALVEFRGVADLKRLDVTAPRRLALNQLAFCVGLFLYGAISLFSALQDPQALVSSAMSQIGGGDALGGAGMEKQMTGIVRMAAIALYGGVMFAALVGPGLMALYYHTRKHYIEQYVSQTPSWILDLQRAGMSL